MKVGVMIPTHGRPDFLRSAVLQWAVQTRKPDLLVINQNGDENSYEWAIEDLKSLVPIKYMHIPAKLLQHHWYLFPLTYLIERDFDVYFWGDHDDIYATSHVATALENLKGYDFTISETCGLLRVARDKYAFDPALLFSSHAPGGMTSSIAFNKEFAKMLAQDLAFDRTTYYSDNVLAKITMPKAKVNKTKSLTTIYVAHSGTVSSRDWVKELEDKP